MGSEKEKAAEIFDGIAAELERAAKHAKIAASHMRNRDIPRYAAHAFAVVGHVSMAKQRLDISAQLHATKASTEEGR